MQYTYNRIFSKFFVFLIGVAAFVFLMRAATKPKPEETRLEQAARAVNWMIAPANLSRSCFTVAFPSAKPSEYVNYMFSDMGVSEWPPFESSGEFTMPEMKAMRIPFFPEDIHVAQLEPDPEHGAQIVIRYDDAKGVVIVDGYNDPAQPPIMSEEYTLKKVPPGPGVIQIFEMNYDMGRDFKSY